PYECDNVDVTAIGVYTNNPPCGAMRGFGAVQACFAYESQMDKLAAACGLSPLEIRRRNAVRQGSRLATGQLLDSPAPLAELLERLEALPLPGPADDDLRSMPGGVSQTTHGESVRRGVGYGVGIKNICFSEGFDDFSTARVRLELLNGEPHVTVHTAAAEVGQGLVTVQAQIARTELGVERVTVATADTSVGSAGSSSASRQSYVTGGAVRAACQAVRERCKGLAPAQAVERFGPIEETREYRHRPTVPLDPVTGQGDSHTQLALCVHRAVVDVDTELGLVKVVALDAVQDVGRALNPIALEGQIHGGSAQGLGLALMEEIQVRDGKVLNASFTDYLIPTVLDMPPMQVEVMEFPDPNAPYGLRGAGEPPTLSSTPAVMAAVRDATGLDLHRVPLRPQDIALR
ncbi:MAG: molybdopterin-dependent oxidoreductase, partial [Thermoactinospora sp.]|nr:molybdopterin-dependent oxidoreductase [Thermoactinospora sp.]